MTYVGLVDDVIWRGKLWGLVAKYRLLSQYRNSRERVEIQTYQSNRYYKDEYGINSDFKRILS